MTAVDTQVLIFAALAAAPHHAGARALLARLAESPVPWAIPWPCVYEFLRVATHPRVYHPPLPLARARGFLAALFASPSLHLLHETDRHAAVLDQVLQVSGVTGNLVHDAHIAAIALEHGVNELLTQDRDFSRFPGLRTRDPFA